MSTKTMAYGSITIVDITDVGAFSVTPESNKPVNVVYDPNSNPATYVPNWSSASPLELTPRACYAGNDVDNNKLTITWQRRDGVGDWSVVSAKKGDTYTDKEGNAVPVAEYVENGVLKVRDNVLATSATKIITYQCTVLYIEPITLKDLTATGQISFSLLENATQIKSCRIKGENVFLYKSDASLSNPTITLTAQLTSNLTMKGWQYWKVTETKSDWATIYQSDNTTQVISKTLGINASNNKIGNGDDVSTWKTYDDLFHNDTLTIRALTSDNSVYDDFIIVKLRDGAAGSGLVTVTLSNEDQIIPFSSEGIGNYDLATTRVYVYKGNTDVTSEWTVHEPTAAERKNVTGTWNKDTNTYSVTGLTADTGYVEFVCTKTNDDNTVTTLRKKFTVSKVTTGKDGVSPTVYSIETNTATVRQSFTYNDKGELSETLYSPSSLTFNAFSQIGTKTETYTGYMEVLTDSGAVVGTSGDVSTRIITFAELSSAGLLNNLKYLVCKLYAPSTNTNPLKTQTVNIISDGDKGVKGDNGSNGVDSLSVVIGNPADQISCYADGKVRNATEIHIPFTAYQGITKTKCTMKIKSGLPTGMSQSSEQQTNGVIATNGDGEIVISVSGDNNYLGNSDEGTIVLEATCYGIGADENEISVTSLHNFGWSKNRQGESGKNNASVQLNIPDGDTINDENDEAVRIIATLLDGSTVVPNQTYSWKKHTIHADGTVTYEPITEEQGKLEISDDTTTLTVYRDAVNGYASYKCEVTYDGLVRYAYQSIRDIHDPIQISVHCTLGNQILNGYGQGAIYVKVMQRGAEVDAIKSEVFIKKGDATPANPVNGKSYYYELDSDLQTVTLKKYDNNKWDNAPNTDLPTYTYQYSFRDKDGKIMTDHNFATSGKVIYIDGSLFEKKVVIEVAVTQP
jgi:hypothetical protein